MAYTLTWQELLDAADHAVGGSPAAGNSSAQVVNRALEHLVNAHRWTWLTTVGPVTLTQFESYAALPADFAELLQVSNGAADFGYLKSVTPYDLLELRKGSSYNASGGTLGYLLATRPPAAGGALLPALEVGPVPQSTLAGALSIVYRRRVEPYLPGTTAAAAVPAVPGGLHGLLLQLARAFAVSAEEQSGGHDWDLANQLLAAAVAQDRAADGQAAGVVHAPHVPGAYTFAELKAEAEAAAGTDPASRLNAAHAVNRAVGYLASFHPWNFRLAQASLSVTAGQPYIDLPADYGEMVAVRASGGSRFTDLRPLPREALIRLADFGPSDGLFIGYAIVAAPQAAGGTAPSAWRMALAPTPSAAAADSITLVYRKLIPTFASRGTADDGRVAAFPAGFQEALCQLVRAFAAATFNPRAAAAEWQLAERMLEAAVRLDSAAEAGNLGPLRNCPTDDWYASADEGLSGGYYRPFTSIDF